jgi:prepilin peptidase CpaA
MSAEIAIAGFLGIAASWEDLKRRTVSNWIPLAALAGGLACHLASQGWRGAGTAAVGAISGFGVFLVFYLLGGMGGGDVKLMAGFGALLGASRLFEAALWTAGIGGVMAAIVLGVAWLRARFRKDSTEKSMPQTIPYAPAIAIGVWLALIPKG